MLMLIFVFNFVLFFAEINLGKVHWNFCRFERLRFCACSLTGAFVLFSGLLNTLEASTTSTSLPFLR